MLSLLQIAILALVQGLTEFLPISSSAHLILVPVVADWPDQGILFDVSVHFGTLLAVMLYFRKTLAELMLASLRSLHQRKQTADSLLAWQLLFSTVPAILAGLLFHDIIETSLRSPLVIGCSTIFFGLLLLWSDQKSKVGTAQVQRTEYSLGWKDVLIIGSAQALALIPGTSRSGITMTSCLFLGLSRETAARFSFLMSIPVILMATSYEGLTLINHPLPVTLQSLLLAIGISSISAYICIHYFMKLIQKLGMLPFALYRFALGIFIFILFI